MTRDPVNGVEHVEHILNFCSHLELRVKRTVEAP